MATPDQHSGPLGGFPRSSLDLAMLKGMGAPILAEQVHAESTIGAPALDAPRSLGAEGTPISSADAAMLKGSGFPILPTLEEVTDAVISG